MIHEISPDTTNEARGTTATATAAAATITADRLTHPRPNPEGHPRRAAAEGGNGPTLLAIAIAPITDSIAGHRPPETTDTATNPNARAATAPRATDTTETADTARTIATAGTMIAAGRPDPRRETPGLERRLRLPAAEAATATAAASTIARRRRPPTTADEDATRTIPRRPGAATPHATARAGETDNPAPPTRTNTRWRSPRRSPRSSLARTAAPSRSSKTEPARMS